MRHPISRLNPFGLFAAAALICTIPAQALAQDAEEPQDAAEADEAAEEQPLIVAPEILDLYAGSYELQPGFVLTITLEDGHLFGQASGQPQFELFAESETRFYLKVTEAQIEFHTNDDGQVDSLTLFQGGQELPARRTDLTD